jgi:hypothetical protein
MSTDSIVDRAGASEAGAWYVTAMTATCRPGLSRRNVLASTWSATSSGMAGDEQLHVDLGDVRRAELLHGEFEPVPVQGALEFDGVELRRIDLLRDDCNQTASRVQVGVT